MQPLPTDDRAPEPVPLRHRVPRGVWWAVALAIVVLAIAAYQATGSSGSSGAGSSDGVAQLDPSLSEPPDSVNPLLPTAQHLIGSPAPDLELTGFDGTAVSLADYVGRPLVVNLWAQSCVPCRAEMPDLERVHQQYRDRVAFLGVDTAESMDTGQPFAEQTGVTYDLASDPQGRLAAALESTGLPTTVLIRPDGTIARIRNAGTVSADQLADWIEQDLLS
jgi:peroxiredoxin